MIDEDSVEKIEDLEKVMLLWQQITKDSEQNGEEQVTLGETLKKEIDGENEISFTRLVIKEE